MAYLTFAGYLPAKFHPQHHQVRRSEAQVQAWALLLTNCVQQFTSISVSVSLIMKQKVLILTAQVCSENKTILNAAGTKHILQMPHVNSP